MKNDEPMRSINPFGLRLQPELKSALESAAQQNKRSLNAEITARLQESFNDERNNEGRMTALELKSLMSELSLTGAMLGLLQQIPKSKEADLLAAQLLERLDAMGDVQQRISDLIKMLPTNHDDAPAPDDSDGSRMQKPRKRGA